MRDKFQKNAVKQRKNFPFQFDCNRYWKPRLLFETEEATILGDVFLIDLMQMPPYELLIFSLLLTNLCLNALEI